MQVTMVKKRLLSGDACKKCVEAEELLRSRGLWSHIGRVVWAVEGEPNSEGMQLGRQFGVATAPFFLIQGGQGDDSVQVIESTLKLIKAISAAHERTHPREKPSRAPARLTREEVADHAERFAAAEPQQSLRFVLERFGADCAIAFSGAEDVVLIDMAVHIGLPVSVFCLDTGRLHPETYRFIDKVRTHYGIEIEAYSPQAEALQAFVRKKGLFSFYEDGHSECCGIRKVEALKRALSKRSAWVTGQRRDQSPTRAAVPVLQVDAGNVGLGGEPLLKCNPLANWSSAQVWSYIRERSIPYNALHERGYISVGCEPCTRPVLPGQHEREGRWWWEEATQKECGLHSVVQPHGDGI